MRTAVDPLEAARTRANAGRFEASKKLLTRFLARETDEQRLARAEAILAYVESELGDVAAGIALCESALGRADGDSHLVGMVLGYRALVHLRGGALNEALSDFDTAISDLDGAVEPLGLAHLNRGNVFLHVGDLDAARRDFVTAETCFVDAGAEVLRAKATANLGYTQLLQGDIIGALSAMSSAANVLARLSAVNKAIAEQDRAEALVAAGMTTEGAQALAEAAKAFGSRRLRQSQGEAEFVLARTLMLDEPSRAATIARRASRRFLRRGSGTWALRADAVALRSEIERGATTLGLAVRSRDISGRLREHDLIEEASALDLQTVRIHLRHDDLESARASIGTIRTTLRTPIATRLLARELRAELALAENRRANALQHVRRGLDELHAWQSSFGSLDLQSSLVGHGRRLAFQGIKLAVQDGRPELVLEWSERARTLVSRVTPVRPPSNPEAADDLAQLRRLQAQEVEEGSPQARQANHLRERIRQRAWYEEGSGEVSRLITMDELRGELSIDDAALIAYVVADKKITGLVVTSDDASVVDLGPFGPVKSLLDGMLADLDMSAASLPTAMHTAVRAGLDDRLHALAARLVEPISSAVGDRRAVITPSGGLWATPWTMLPGFVGRPLTVPQSATRWTMRHRVHFAPSSAGFVAGPDVPRSEEEIRKASSAWGRSTTLLDGDATANGVAGLARTVDVLHVSAHGRHSADNPLFSGLELADGPWFGYDIDQLPRIPATVVLSACEVGRSSVRWAEESVGMTAAWLHAGARCVIASHASVADDLACDVLARTHQLVASGQPPADALARASGETSEAAASSFICFGTGW